MSDKQEVAVRIPGVGVVYFPASMSDAEIAQRRDQMIYESQGHGKVGNAVGTVAEAVGNMIPKSIAPAVGGAIGSMAGPPGAIVGSMAGEGVNQMLGVTEPSLQDVVTSGAFTAGGLGLVRGAGGLVRRLPGAPYAMHEMQNQKLQARPGTYAPTRPSEDLYAIVDKMQGVHIPTSNLRSAAQNLLRGEEKLGKTRLQNDEIVKIAQGALDETAQYVNSEIPFQTLRAMLKRYGERTGTMAGQTADEVRGAYKFLQREALKDMESAATRGNPASGATQALKEANAARKMEHVVEDLGDLFSINGGGLTPRPDGAGFQINFGTIIKKLHKDPSIRKSMGDPAFEELLGDLQKMWKVTDALPAPRGVDAGSRNVNLRGGILGSLGGAAGAYMTGTAAGGIIGAGLVGGGGLLMHKLLASLVATKAGRSVLKGMLDGNRGVISMDALAAVAPAVGMTEFGREASHGVTDATQGFVGGLTQ